MTHLTLHSIAAATILAAKVKKYPAEQAMLMAKNGVDGIYSDDPRTNPNAKFIKSLTFKEMMDKNLKVMDQTAVSLCMDTPIEVRVFNMADASNFLKILDGEEVGTTMKQGE